jgi:hypothetical protein
LPAAHLTVALLHGGDSDCNLIPQLCCYGFAIDNIALEEGVRPPLRKNRYVSHCRLFIYLCV